MSTDTVGRIKGYITADAIFEDIPPHSRDFSHELGGYPIKEPFFLHKKANEIPYLLR